ncbi:sigma-70 family RNA polymerase sigma factor [soil metagenome]
MARRGAGREDEEATAALVARAGKGDQAAYEVLVDRFAGLVWSIARSHRLNAADAGDVSQTTWLRFVEHLDRIREPERLAGWLSTTARNESIAVLRRQGRSVPTGHDLDDADETFLADLGPAPDARLLGDERAVAVGKAFGGLPARCQELLRLLLHDPPISYEEIGATLDLPIGSIGPTRGRCLDRLRNHPEIVRITSGTGPS